MSRENPRHGTLTGYTHDRCRCTTCGDAYRSYQQQPHVMARARATAALRRPLGRDKRRAYEQRPDIAERSRAQRYGLTAEQLRALLAPGICSACGTTDHGGNNWHIDHDHACCATKKSCGRCVRGVLCSGCNLALGHLKDNRSRVVALLGYLDNWQSR